jgi:hypothetical protein
MSRTATAAAWRIAALVAIAALAPWLAVDVLMLTGANAARVTAVIAAPLAIAVCGSLVASPTRTER